MDESEFYEYLCNGSIKKSRKDFRYELPTRMYGQMLLPIHAIENVYFVGKCNKVLTHSVDVIYMYNKESIAEQRPWLYYNQYGDTYPTPNNYCGEFRVLSYLTLQNSKTVVCGSGKYTGNSTRQAASAAQHYDGGWCCG